MDECFDKALSLQPDLKKYRIIIEVMDICVSEGFTCVGLAPPPAPEE
jgi:hypothetical protein